MTVPKGMLDAARAYLQRGWAVVPIPSGRKAPARAEWPDLRLKPEDLPLCLSNGEGIGIILGHASGGLADVDLDAPEAVRLAPMFLPGTSLVHGRPGKPASHRWYNTRTALQPGQFRAPDGTMIVELRTGPGQQTVVPPSQHPSGEILGWEAEGEPANVDAQHLRRAVSRLAAAALLARAWPRLGSRHDAALALAGALLSLNLSEGEAGDFVRAVAEAAGDEEVVSRVHDVVSTARRQAADQPTTGFPRLAMLLGKNVVDRVEEWLGRRTAASTSIVGGRQTQATVLIGRADSAEFFGTPDGVPYARIPVGDHWETWAVRSRTFRRWLARRYYEHTQAAPSAQPMSDALAVLESRALFDGETAPVHVRVAVHDGAIYLDLADQEWKVAQITTAGWQIVTDPPVRFRRPGGMSSLPCPVAGGSVEDLRPFVNVASEPDFHLIVVYEIACLQGAGPFPVLALHGEQGTAKTTTGRVLRSVVDPNTSPLRAEPREQRDLMIAAANGWVIAIDNISHLHDWLSDALCRLSTGGGFSTRELYTDSDEVIFNAMRPVILTSIDDGTVVRSDLLDRSMILYLPTIPENRRQAERTFWAEFALAQPRILGALLDAASTALRRLPFVYVSHLPRMADLVLWATAAEEAFGWKPGTALEAYTGNRTEGHELALEGSAVAVAVRTLADEMGRWEGRATDLLSLLNGRVEEEIRRNRRTWPQTPKALSGALRRVAPNLRVVGVQVAFSRTDKRRVITLQKVEESSVRNVRIVRMPIAMASGHYTHPLKPDASLTVDAAKKATTDVHDEGDVSPPPSSRTGAVRDHEPPKTSSEGSCSDVLGQRRENEAVGVDALLEDGDDGQAGSADSFDVVVALAKELFNGEVVYDGPRLPRHASPTDGSCQSRLLAHGHDLGFPRLPLGFGQRIETGEGTWRQFCGTGGKLIEAVLTILETTEGEGLAFVKRWNATVLARADYAILSKSPQDDDEETAHEDAG